MSVLDLLERGILEEGEQLVIVRRSAPPVEGLLNADGTIKVGTIVCHSPSEAARRALGDRPVDGWLRWRVVRLENATLASLREAV